MWHADACVRHRAHQAWNLAEEVPEDSILTDNPRRERRPSCVWPATASCSLQIGFTMYACMYTSVTHVLHIYIYIYIYTYIQTNKLPGGHLYELNQVLNPLLVGSVGPVRRIYGSHRCFPCNDLRSHGPVSTFIRRKLRTQSSYSTN